MGRLSTWLLLITLACTSGCITLSRQGNSFEWYLRQSEPERALRVLEVQYPQARNKILFDLQRGFALRMLGNTSKSNSALEGAKQDIGKIEALSIREQVAAMSINDLRRSYLPPTFEQVWLYCIKILNYLESSNIDGARVESLQLLEKLQHDFHQVAAGFPYYLTGLVFEFNGEPDQALVSYRKAWNSYQQAGAGVPAQLQTDLHRLAVHLGVPAAVPERRRTDSKSTFVIDTNRRMKAEVVIVIFSGLRSKLHAWSATIQSPADGQYHQITLPYYEVSVPQINAAEVLVADESHRAERYADIDQQASIDLHERMPAIMARAMARVAIKNAVSDSVANEDPLLGVLTNITGLVSEQADTRGWFALPQQVWLCRLYLDPGDHALSLKLTDQLGISLAAPSLNEITLLPGSHHLISIHYPDSKILPRYSDATEPHHNPYYPIPYQ